MDRYPRADRLQQRTWGADLTDWNDWYAALDQAMPRGWNREREARSPLARWAQQDEIGHDDWRWSKGDPAILLGRYDDRLIARRDDDRHVITVAGSRAGKGRSLILPNLVTWPGSVVAIDPKGELARKTARHRAGALKQQVLILDPFGVSGWKGASYNPLDELDPNNASFMDDVALVADALIMDDPKDRHWTDASKNLIRTMILWMIASGSPATLPRLRAIMQGSEGKLMGQPGKDDSPMDYFFWRMRASDAFGGFLKLVAGTFIEKNERELGSILSTAREQTNFLDSPAMASVLANSDFRLRSLKVRPTTVYMCLPATRLATHFRWLRVIVNLTLAALEEEHPTPNPVLLLLEEFAGLGHMEAIEKAAGQIAGFGVKLWAILQDLGQLKAIYKERWETFLGNAGITTWFGLNDLTSLEYVSNRLGDTHFTRMEKVDATMTQRGHGAAEYREAVVNSKLLTPEEVGRFFSRETRRVLTLHPGSRPMILQRLDVGDEMFKGMIDAEQSRK